MRSLNEILEKTEYKHHELDKFWTQCYFDFIYFCKHVFGFQIGSYHEEWYELLEKFPRLSIQAFRGSGKTTFMAAYLIWKSVFKENTNCLIIGHNMEQSKLVLKVLKNLIVDNEILKEFVPTDRKYSWRATEITLINGSIFYSRTYGEGVRGLRIDYLLCDEAGQYEDKTTFWVAISPVVHLNQGRIIVIGTPTSPVDLLAELWENEEYFSKKYPAESDGKATWSHRYTMGENAGFGRTSLFKVKREIGELNYMQEYLLVPISAVNAVFPMQMVMSSLNDRLSFRDYGLKEETYFVGVDLAISQKGDYSVYTVINANADGKTVVYAERFRGGINEQIDKLKRINERFRPTTILVDKTGLGEQIFREFQAVNLNVTPFHFTAEEKHNVIMDLRHEFELGKFSLPNNKESLVTYNYIQALISELKDFQIRVDQSRRVGIKFSSGKHDDTVISLALANRASKNYYKQISVGFI